MSHTLKIETAVARGCIHAAHPEGCENIMIIKTTTETIHGRRLMLKKGDRFWVIPHSWGGWEYHGPAVWNQQMVGDAPGVHTSEVVPRGWFPAGGLGDQQHQCACWAVLDPDDASGVDDYAPAT